jgi:hypothetical protein
MLGLMQTDDSEFFLAKISKNYPKKAVGLFRIYEWMLKEHNKRIYQNRPVARFSQAADWREQVIFGIPEVE